MSSDEVGGGADDGDDDGDGDDAYETTDDDDDHCSDCGCDGDDACDYDGVPSFLCWSMNHQMVVHCVYDDGATDDDASYRVVHDGGYGDGDGSGDAVDRQQQQHHHHHQHPLEQLNRATASSQARQ